MMTLIIDSLPLSKKLTKKPAVMFLAALLILPLPTLEIRAGDPARSWTTVGSAGTVDEGDTGKVILDQGNVSLKGVVGILPPTELSVEAQGFAEQAREEAEGALTIKAVIRYNITAVDGLIPFDSRAEGYIMRVRFQDNGVRAQVLLRLIEYDLSSGVETVRMIFDSNQFSAQQGYQTQQIGGGCSTFQMDFRDKAYYVEATLTSAVPQNTAFAGDPRLGIIQIFSSPCLF